MNTTQPALKKAWELAIKLRETGTGEGKLDILREFMTRNPQASALEGLKYLRESGRVHPATVYKAEQLVEFGELPKIDENTRPVYIEDELALYAGREKKQAAVAAAALANPVKTSTGPANIPTDEQRREAALEAKRLEAAKAEQATAQAALDAEREKTKQAEIAAATERAKAEAEAKAREDAERQAAAKLQQDLAEAEAKARQDAEAAAKAAADKKKK